jgi:hypothetical protein
VTRSRNDGSFARVAPTGPDGATQTLCDRRIYHDPCARAKSLAVKVKMTSPRGAPGRKGDGLMNREVIFCAAGVLSAAPLTYSRARDGSDFVAFCFAKLEDTSVFAKRFGGERCRRPAGGDPETGGATRRPSLMKPTSLRGMKVSLRRPAPPLLYDPMDPSLKLVSPWRAHAALRIAASAFKNSRVRWPRNTGAAASETRKGGAADVLGRPGNVRAVTAVDRVWQAGDRRALLPPLRTVAGVRHASPDARSPHRKAYPSPAHRGRCYFEKNQ